MFLRNGKYDADLHHDSLLAVGVPGTVAGLHLAWSERGTRPWKKLLEPAIALARDGRDRHRRHEQRERDEASPAAPG